MQNIEKMFRQLYKTNRTLKFAPSVFRFLSTDKSSVDTPFNESIVQENTSSSINESLIEKIFENLKDDFEQTSADRISVEKSHDLPKTFAGLLRHSNFMHLGDPEGKQVIGKIFEVVNNDLYIDFGWKFHCVCTKPLKNKGDYVRGAKVLLMIKDLELSTRFLGSTKDVTLLEADCVLLSLLWSPCWPVTRERPSIEKKEI